MTAPIEVFTDGACAGNPGRGGWAWAVAPDGAQHGSGGEAHTTNQRMELKAVLEALRALPGELTIVSSLVLRRASWAIMRASERKSAPGS